MRSFLIVLSILLSSFSAMAQKNVAVVKLLRGEVDVVNVGKTTRLKDGDWVVDGSVIKTAEKSFVKLVFTDKSQMNMGPSSEMRIEKFTDKDASVIELVKGKVRSQVTKDYLQIQNKDRSKMFIKTQNAVLGIRGTDFMVSTNGINTATVLFEGEVVFNKIDSPGSLSTEKLEQIVDSGVRIMPGEFSVMDAAGASPTVPSLLNVNQLEKLEKNENFDTERSPGSDSASGEAKSVVPPGLTGAAVSNTAETLKTEVAQATPVVAGASSTAVSPPSAASSAAAAKSAEGFSNGDSVKPANGSFVHIESGVIIPPGPGSVLDPNTNTFIPSQSGKISADGSYVPPKNVEITNDGKILVAVADTATGTVKVQEVPKPSVVFSNTGVSLAKVSEVLVNSPTAASGPAAIAAGPKNDILNKNFVPSGLSDVSNNQRNQTGGIQDVAQQVNIKTTTDVTIQVQ